MDGLRRRSLIERGQRAGSFTLHSVVLEYVTGRLVSTASEEIRQGRLSLLLQHGLSQDQAKEYVQKATLRALGPWRVQPLTVVENSDISPTCLTFPLDGPYSSFSEGNSPASSFQAKRISS